MQELSSAIVARWRELLSRARNIGIADALLIFIALGSAALIRYSLLSYKSADFHQSLKDWYVTIRTLGFSAFAGPIGNYNPPYLYELYLIARFFPDTSNLLATKIPSLVGDFVAAIFVFLLVRARYSRGPFAALAVFAFLLAPTVVLNSSFWGQADVLYTAPILACLYFLVRRQNGWAMLAYGVALAFKLQAIFLAPLLLGLLLRGTFSWKQVLLVPIVLLASLVPAALAGRPLSDLISIYSAQAGQYQRLQMSAATVYAWLPDYGLTQRFFTPAGIAFTIALSLVLAILIWRTRTSITPTLLIRLSLLCFLLVPFFLPKMHDRYFYPADVLAILFAFFLPRYFYVPIVVMLGSFFSYHPTLFGVETVPMAILAVGMFSMLVVVAGSALRTLLTPHLERNPIPRAVELES